MNLAIEIPESAFSALRLRPDEFLNAMRLAAAVKWYEAEMLSQSKASELAGVSREEFLRATGRFRVSAVQYTPEELAEELGRD
jgi:predicted HTH domain antitoxin